MAGFADGILSPQICLGAAAILAGQRADGSGDEAAGLLEALGYRVEDNPGSGDVTTVDNRLALLRLAAGLRRLFRITPPDAPHLQFLGGEADTVSLGGPAEDDDRPRDTVSLAGAGLTPREAFERCVGEGAEYLSQLASVPDIDCRARASEASHGLVGDALPDVLAMLGESIEVADPEIGWVEGRCLASAAQILLPADLCVRRPASECGHPPRVNLGTGCAAGPTETAATVAAILEVIERDAAALWWVGGRPPRPISMEVSATAGADALVRRVRGAAATRHSWLLDISTDLGIPCVASVSLTSEGDGFACGLAAGLTIGAAIRSAIVEMCQMELGHRIVALKRRQRGVGSLNRHDLAQLDRARTIDANTPIIQPKGLPNGWKSSSDNSAETELYYQYLLQRFEELGANIYVVNLTRGWLEIPVSKVIVTGLQPYPSEIETYRLKRTIEQYNAGNKSAPRIPLL